jgi:ribosomal protein S13
MTTLLRVDPMTAVRADEWRDKGRDDVADIMMRVLHPIEQPKKRVDQLTKRQIARIPEFVTRWVAIGRSTQPADRPLFEAAVTECYRFAGLAPPRVQWCPSPIVAVLAGPQVSDQVRVLAGPQVSDQVRAQVSDQVSDQVRAQVSDQVRNQVGVQVNAQVNAQVRAQVSVQVSAQVGDQVEAQVSDRVRAQVSDRVRAQVSAQVRDQVSAQVGDQVEAQVRDQVSAQVGDQVRDWWRYFGGQFWVGGWYYGSPSVVSFLVEACGLLLPDDIRLRARAYMATCESACWWYPTRDVVFVSERPRTLEFHDAGQTKLKRVAWDGWEVLR